jgi:hypothetical protein
MADMTSISDYNKAKLEELRALGDRADAAYAYAETVSKDGVNFPNPGMDSVPPENIRYELYAEDISDARTTLESAIKANQASGTQVAGVSPEQAETILQWSVENARQYVIDLLGMDEAITNPYLMNNTCTEAQAAAGMPLMDTMSPNEVRVTETPDGTHKMLVVDIPVESAPGQIETKTYLIDPTLRQFSGLKHGGKPDVGHYMNATEEGKAVANEILSKGYAELTEANAKGYAEAFVQKARDDGKDVPTPADGNWKDYLKSSAALTSEKTPENAPDYTRFEIARDDMRMTEGTYPGRGGKPSSDVTDAEHDGKGLGTNKRDKQR